MYKLVKAARAKIAGVTAGASAMLASVITAYADNPFAGAEETITNLFENLQGTLLKVVIPIAGCALAFCFIMSMVSTNQKNVEQYRAWLFRIFICVVGIFAVSFIVTLATGIGQSFG